MNRLLSYLLLGLALAGPARAQDVAISTPIEIAPHFGRLFKPAVREWSVVDPETAANSTYTVDNRYNGTRLVIVMKPRRCTAHGGQVEGCFPHLAITLLASRDANGVITMLCGSVEETPEAKCQDFAKNHLERLLVLLDMMQDK